MNQTTVPAYEMLAQDIKASGIDTVFGLMSEDTALLITSLDAISVRFLAARHENTAIAMAEGYAAATGRLGIAIIGRGPASANALHAAVFAHRAGSGVLLIFGYQSTSPGPRGVGPDTKDFDAGGVLKAAGLEVRMAVDTATVRLCLAQAMAAAQRGCVSLLLPTNVQFGLVARTEPVALTPFESAKPPQARAGAIAATARMLQQCCKPLFVVGAGAYHAGAGEAIERLAEKVGAVLATTLKAKDMYRGRPYNLGIIGSLSHSAARRFIDEADCVVVFGAGLNLRTTSYGKAIQPNVPLAHVDLSAGSIGRWFPADIALVGDALEVAQALCAAVPDKPEHDKSFHTNETRRFLADFDMASDFVPANTPRTMDPRSVALELDRLLPPDRNAVYDTGNFLQVVPYFPVASPRHLKNSHDFASIGLGLGTALGFARGAPDRVTVLFIGDGGFLMTMGELETVVREDIPLVIVLMNDCAYGAELHHLTLRSASPALSVFPDVDYAPVAEAFGFTTATVRTIEELRALGPVLRNPEGPIFIDCKINASVAGPFLLETAEYERGGH